MKRGRSRSVPENRVRRSPFLPSDNGAAGQWMSQMEALETVVSRLLFWEEIKPQKAGRASMLSSDTIKTIEKATSLIREEKLSVSVGFTKGDLAVLLLDVSGKILSFIASKEYPDPVALKTLWESLWVSLETMLKNPISSDLGRILSQSILNKLVSFALKCSFEESATGKFASDTFCLLVDTLYHPNLDQFCSTIMVDFASAITASQVTVTGGRLDLHNSYVLSCMVSILGFIKSHQEKGTSSPKRIFQLLSGEDVLMSLARLALLKSDVSKNLVKGILWEAFFSPQYHIDGYLSIKMDLPQTQKDNGEEKKSSFHCYQEDLLSTVTSLLRGAKHTVDTIAVFNLVELLLEGLVLQTLDWKTETKHGGKGRAAISSLQFRFWANMADPMLQRIEASCTQNELMAKFSSCMNIILRYRSYHQTYDDPEKYHFSFLRSICDRIIELLRRRKSIIFLPIINDMIQLNHLLVHEKLSEVVLMAAMSYSSATNNEFSVFIGSLYHTYKELRQIDYLILVFVGGIGMARKLPDTKSSELQSAVKALKSVFEDQEVVRSVSLAVASIPHGQMKAIFHAFNNCIQDILEVQELSALAVESLSFVIVYFALILRSIRVQDHIAAKISSLCRDSLVYGSSLVLAKCSACGGERYEEVQEIEKAGMVLCGSILELQTRCSFWTQSDATMLHLPSEVASLLDGSSRSINSAQPELCLLACYRIQQLHSLLHESHREEFSVESTSETESIVLLEEARQLVDNVFVHAESRDTRANLSDEQSTSRDDVWVVLSQFLPSWIPYCSKDHIRRFLLWIFSMVAQPELECTGQSVASCPYKLQRQAVEALLRDSSLYENPMLARDFVLIGISKMQEVLVAEFTPEDVFTLLIDVDFSYPHADVSPLVSSNFALGLKMTRDDIPRRIDVVTRGFRILSVINRAPEGFRRSENPSALMHFLYGMDILCRVLVDSNIEDSVLLLSQCRLLLSKIIAENEVSKTRVLVCKTDWLKNAVTGIIFSTAHIQRCDQSESQAESLTAASCDLLEIVASCLKVSPMDSIRAILRSSTFKASKVENMCLYSILTGFHRASKVLHVDTSRGFGQLVFNELVIWNEKNVPVCRWSFFKLIGAAGTLAGAIGELNIRLSDLIAEESEIPSKMLTYMAGLALQGGSDSDSLPEFLLHHLFESSESGPVETTVLCHLLLRSKPVHIRHFLDQILFVLPFSRNGKHWDILRLLLQSTKRSDLRELLGKYGNRIFVASVDSLVASKSSDLQMLRSSANMVLELMKHRDVVLVKERDISRFLSQVCCLLKANKIESGYHVEPDLFSISCSLVTSLTQRFPKQIYSCISTFILALQKLFHAVTYSWEKESIINEKTRELSRLFELLIEHREIIKKHVLGIIADFVSALKADMTSIRKKALTPLVNSLLELISEHEISQLNTLLDTTGKALFRSHYEAFQKWHTYKGQY